MNQSLEQIEAAQDLTLGERNRLVALEAAIERSVRTSLEAGRALREIRDTRLYRAAHATFEAYAKERFAFERAHTYRLIQMADVVDVVSPLESAPKVESHARELAPLLDEPEKLRETWSAATTTATAAGRPVTAEDVREARRQLKPAPEPPAPEPPPIGDAPDDLRFAHIEEGVQILKMLPAADRIVWPTDEGDLEAVGEAVEWLARYAPALGRAWREHKRSRRRLRVV